MFISRKCWQKLSNEPQEMLDVLKSKVEEGVIESSDLPRLPTIQGWMFVIEREWTVFSTVMWEK